MKMKRWYGMDCRQPSTGWKACEPKGVGTGNNSTSLGLLQGNNEQPSLTYPFVVRLMDIFVKDGNMQPSVYPIDTIVSEQKVASRRVNVAHYMKTGRKLTVAQTRIDRNNHMCQVHRTTWNIPSLLLGTKVMSTASSQGRPVDSFEFLGGLGF